MITFKKLNGACKAEIEIASNRKKTFVNLQRLYLFFGSAQSKGRTPDTVPLDWAS